MARFETAAEIILGVFLVLFALLYVLQRARLFFALKHARHVIGELAAFEAAVVSNTLPQTFSAEREMDTLERLNRTFASESRRLRDWRSSEMERLIIGDHIDALLFQCERACAMTSRLLALLGRLRPEAGPRRSVAEVQQRGSGDRSFVALVTALGVRALLGLRGILSR